MHVFLKLGSMAITIKLILGEKQMRMDHFMLKYKASVKIHQKHHKTGFIPEACQSCQRLV